MKKIAPDKWKHFYVGLAMGVFFQCFACWLLPKHLPVASLGVLAIVIFISYGFELFSKFTGYGHYEVMDAVAAIIGGLLGMGLSLTVFLLV
jgi:VanZ family protein